MGDPLRDLSYFENLAARYRMLSAKAPTRERALLEQEILDYSARTGFRQKGEGKPEWFASEFNVSSHDVDLRQRILALRNAADPLWERLDADMTLSTCMLLARQAKARRVGEKCTLEIAVQREIATYDALPIATYTADGKVIRKESVNTLPREKKKTKPVDEDAQSFWNALRTLISDHFRTKLDGLDPMSVEQAWRTMEVDLKIVLNTHQEKLSRLRTRHVEKVGMMSRGKIISAYKALHLEAPKPSAAIDIKPVKRQFRKLAQLYHPDKSGTETTRDLYEKVVEAYRIIEEVWETQQGAS